MTQTNDSVKAYYDTIIIDGYIRLIQENQMKQQIIPTPINQICYGFYHIAGYCLRQIMPKTSETHQCYTSDDDTINNFEDEQEMDQQNTSYRNRRTSIGDIVRIKTIGIEGMVKFIGQIHGKIGIYYGVEFNQSYPNIVTTNDGSIGNIYYIPKTIKNKVMFVQKQEIINIHVNRGNSPRLTVGDIKFVPKYGCKGIVRFIGYTEFKPNKIWYGVQLENAVGKNNGIIRGHKYFQCEKRKGIFVQLTAFILQ